MLSLAAPPIVAALSTAIVSWALVALVYRYALRRGVFDQPKERSSHTLPTPRGGGAALAPAVILGYLLAAPPAGLAPTFLLAIAGVLPAAIAGWLDDHGSLPVGPRLAAQVLSGLLLLPLALDGGLPTALRVLIGAGWLVATVSAINVVNFMDGLDGFIGLQALVFGSHLALLAGVDGPGGILGIMLAAAATGFLAWNWSPARIFLGDVGSGSIAVLGLAAGIMAWREHQAFLPFFLPLFPIFLDASVTMLRRVRGGHHIAEAHRSHLYQRLANERGWGHARVSLLYGAVAAMASASVVAGRTHVLVTSVAYMALVVLIGWLLDRNARA